MPTVDRATADRRAASLAHRVFTGSARQSALRLALGLLDLTTLEGADTPATISALCARAARPGLLDGQPLPPVAAVCVYPALVPAAVEALDRLGARDRARPERFVRIASVATAFPSGQLPLDLRLREVEAAIAAGADEIDMVINRGLFLSGRDEEVAREIREVVAICESSGPARLKVILETGELGTYDDIRRAADLAIASIRNGDFIKTSTGKVSPAATPGVTLVMLEAIRDEYRRSGRVIGMKPAGGIRTAQAALHYLAILAETMAPAWGRRGERCPWLTPEAFRFGASSLLGDILAQLRLPSDAAARP